MDTLLSLLGLGQNTLLALLAAVIGAVGLFFGGRVSGAARERDKQAKRDNKALGEQIEMHREATQAEMDAARLSDEEARRKAARWAR